MSESTPGVNVPRASDLMRLTVSLPASISTPAALYSIWSEIERADERLHQTAARRALGRFPVGPPRQGEEALFVEILFEHVEPFGQQRDRLIAVGAPGRALEQFQHERRVPQRDGSECQRDRRAGRIARRDADL